MQAMFPVKIKYSEPKTKIKSSLLECNIFIKIAVKTFCNAIDHWIVNANTIVFRQNKPTDFLIYFSKTFTKLQYLYLQNSYKSEALLLIYIHQKLIQMILGIKKLLYMAAL